MNRNKMGGGRSVRPSRRRSGILALLLSITVLTGLAGVALPFLSAPALAICTVTGAGTLTTLQSGDVVNCVGAANTDVATANNQTGITVNVGDGSTATSLDTGAAQAIRFNLATNSFITVFNLATITSDNSGIRIDGGSNNVVAVNAGASIATGSNGSTAISITNSNFNQIDIGGTLGDLTSLTFGLEIDGTSTGNLVNVLPTGLIQASTGNALYFVFANGSNTVVNQGTISSTLNTAIHGSDTNDTIVNSGTISGDGLAIDFRDGDDRLELQAGFLVTGFVLGGNGTDTLALGGDSDSNFVVSIGPVLQYREFEILEKTGSSTWKLLTSTNETMTFNVTDGTAIVEGTFSNFTTNVNGGALGGAGTLGGVTFNNGGTLAPGNSVGTLNVASATFNAGSVYEVELNDGGNTAGVNNDLLNATGAVTINGGTVHVTPENVADDGSTYTPGLAYTIITAGGGVTGAFDALTDDYAFLSFALGYDANNVYLNSLLAAPSFCLSGMTANQCATGDAVFSLGAGTVFAAVANLSNAEAPAALDQLSGEIHASLTTALIEDSRFVRESANDRIRNAFADASANTSANASQVSAYGVAYGGISGDALPSAVDGAAFWGRGYGAWGDWNGNGNAAAFDRSIGGFLLGADAPAKDDIRLGLLGGFSRTDLDIADRRSSGTVESYSLGAYGGGVWGGFALRGGAAVAWHDVRTGRSVAFPGFTDSLTADYDARSLQVFAEAAYGFDHGQVRLEPFAHLAYVNVATEGFTETGGAAALTAAARTDDASFATLGLRAEGMALSGPVDARWHGSLGYRRSFAGDSDASPAFAFGGSAFAIEGVPVARDTLALDLGIDLKLSPNASFGVSGSGQFGSGVSDQSLKAEFTINF